MFLFYILSFFYCFLGISPIRFLLAFASAITHPYCSVGENDFLFCVYFFIETRGRVFKISSNYRYSKYGNEATIDTYGSAYLTKVFLISLRIIIRRLHEKRL